MSEKTRRRRRESQEPGIASQVPEKATLGFATLWALAAAGVVLVLFVLPAEYGIDPTGVGRLTGLTKLGGAAPELDVSGQGTVNRIEAGSPRNDTFVLTLDGAGDDLEFKFHLEANQSMLYAWTSTGPVDFDFHGEPDDPSRPGEFASYEDSQGQTRSGSFQAPFDGRHGWYFRNVWPGEVTITLRTWGYYDVVGRV